MSKRKKRRTRVGRALDVALLTLAEMLPGHRQLVGGRYRETSFLYYLLRKVMVSCRHVANDTQRRYGMFT